MNLSQVLEDKLIPIYTNYFYDDAKSEDERFGVLASSVCIHILSNLYPRFMKDSEIQSIDDISDDKKEKYLRIAKTYYTTKSDIEKAIKSAYVLELITSS